ncbi:class I SAM-dependent methyltransferase [Oceaniglobus trochenteri]|uniref:class I SAM-dependent methyltransferase n=1 Tax=Oceaniglobus trochenteri TaxID=2763260 RepID=UPI001CFF570A|nr:class I SAM-dependent methyltransferase [Oceaniglobus trochenteri]
MSGDPQTLAVYAAHHAQYAALTEPASARDSLRRFIARLPRGGAALDLGCGPGHAAAEMARAGLVTTAFDLSPEMVALAASHPGVKAMKASFDDLKDEAAFHGIWANFSLLHAPRAAFPGHLDRICRALKPGGILHLGMKTGTGTDRDALGRLYTYYSADDLVAHLDRAGLTAEPPRHGKGRGLAGTTDPHVIILARRPG